MRKRNKSNLKRTFLQAAAATTLLMLSGQVSQTHAGEVGVTPLLEGIGFYEMIDFKSVNGASLAGGTEIVIYGQGMSHNPATISAIFTNQNLGSGQGGPPRQSDIAFSSHTDGGKLKYTSPSLWDIHNKPREAFDSFEWVTYEVSLVDYDSMTQQVKTLKCSGMFPASNCFFTYSRAFTPILYSVTPPVVYSDSEISFWIDPRSTQQKKSPTLPEFPFVEVRLDGYGVDFEGFIEEDTVLPTYTKVNVRGKMGAITPNPSADVMLRFRVGYAMHMEASTIRCSYNNQTCYKAKAVARIDSIDASQGYSTGGQILTVKGHGFESEKIVAKVDGVNCAIIEKSQEYLKCLTGANAAPSTGTRFVGQHGLKRRFYNSTFQLTGSNLTSSTEFKDMLAVDLEAPFNVKDGHSGNTFTGYFKAPATAGYRFYIACDDWCQIRFSSVNMDPSASSTIYTSDGVTGFRNYFTFNGRKMTPWLNLTQDSYYFMEVSHIQRFGADHLSVAVEIEDTSIAPGHHHTMREIQRLQINQNLTRDTTNVTITNPDGGEFTLTHTDPKNARTFVSRTLNTNMSDWDFNQAVAPFYSAAHNAWITVSRTMYDFDGNVTTSVLDSVSTVFSIQVQRSLAMASANTITVQRISTLSPILISLPRDTQLSSPPMTGTFRIRCALNQDGSITNETLPINQTNMWSGNIRDRIVHACPQYRDKIEAWSGPGYSYNEDGRDLILRFVGVNYDVPQLQIIEDYTSLTGVNIQFNSSTWYEYNPQRIFYEPVPFEFLHTAEDKPQVIVSVEGVEAVCASLNCGYIYVPPTAEITAFSYSGTTLTITGTSLPSSIKSVKFSNIDCTSVVVTGGTSLTCEVTAVAGSWSPVVTDEFGIIPVASGVPDVVINIVVSSVTPSTALNPYGGTILTIVGSYFPQSLTEGNVISLTFNDGSKCEVISISSTQVRCLTNKFSTLASTTRTLTVNVNSKIDSSKTVQITTAPSRVTLLTPSSVSPVLKNLLTINITGFPFTIDKDDLEVSVMSTNLATPIVRQINVVEAGIYGAGHYIKAKFGGSESGIYQLKVRSRTYGNFDTTGITLTTIGKVTNFNPKSGSVHGGTLITIDGYHFSDDYQDNPIRIGYTDCLVESTSPTQIKCRTEPRVQETTGVEDFIVLLKTYEEALCGLGTGNCQYTWTDTAAVTSYSVDFDNTLNHYVLTVTGTGFGATIANTQVFIDSLKQDMISASNTQLKVKIVNILTTSSLNTDIHLPVGHPGGTDDLNYATGITLTPRIHGITPSIGSLGGALITADVRGFGNMTTDVQLVTSAGIEICATVSIVKYGEVQCLTKENAVVTGALSLKVGGTTYPCSSATNACDYQTSDTLLTVSAVSSSGNTISLTGSGFTSASSGSTPKFMFASIFADSVTVNSDTSATATFSNGIPLTNDATGIIGKLYFQSNTTPLQQWALFSASATFANPVTAIAIDSDISCSYAGGCQLSISQAGLSTSLSGDSRKNQVRVCGQLCKYSAADSTDAVAKCNVPALPTAFAIDNFKIIGESYLMGVPFSSNSALTMSVWDGSNQNGWTSNSANCFFGTAFRAGYIGQLNEVKYFMSRFNKNNFIGKLKFQGSTDSTTWTDIFVVGKEIHEGWNYMNYPAGQELKYRFYRFFGTGAGSCIVGEVSLRGYEVIDSSLSSHTCGVSLTINGGAAAIPLTGSVTYQSTVTPLLKSISPRFGSVVGNELITFEGEGFSTTQADYTVMIDGVKCDIASATATQFTCLTSKRPGLYPNPTLDIKIAGKGSVATQGLIFRYVNRWSEPLTWGGEFAPIDGDMVYVPKGLSLLVDIDSSPILSAVVVEGALIFPPSSNPNHLRTFDAHYVMVRGGLFEAGTEQFPYSSKLLITMHSNRSSPELPIFGNKVIAMYNGVLDLHGMPRTPTWTELDVTADIGSTSITLIRDVDWQVNEKIVIAPTGYFNTEAEERTIISVDRTNPNKPVVTIDKPLEFKHFAGVQHFGASGQDWIEMRAEVGLLSRNVMYRGDPETSAAREYGAQIMVHSNGMETLTARIEYVHFFNVGQAFQLGRYPIHFHLIGAVHNSYIKGNSIQQSFNRACTIHGVHYLRVTENVAYNVKGHNFFIEDAAETKNFLENNLAILTKKSWSLLNSDQSPASFWITNPDNIFRGNHAAGSDNYGFWFDTKPNPTGPSFDPNICPENNPLGEFSNNVAHSNGRYGLRIFHKLKPRTYPCSDLIYDKTNVADPYWQNPSVPAVFQNFTSFKNRRNGAIALDIGHVRFENFKVSDNLLAGIEVELADTMVDGYAMVDGALVIGRSDNADFLTNDAPSHGIIGPRTEGFQVHNVKFYNFDIAGKAALGSCSHCFSAPSTDSGGRMVTFSKLTFDSSVTIKIRYQEPWREIFYDLDGSLTGLGPKTWATSYWRHNEQPECQVNMQVYDGLLCNSQVEVRRVVFYNYSPDSLNMMEMKVLQIDDHITAAMNSTQKAAYINNIDNYSVLPWRPKANPKNSWAMPLVTGKKYKIHWQKGVDFMKMQIDLSPHWKTTDKDVYLVHNFTDVRAQIDFLTGGDNIKNQSLLTTNNALKQTGANVVYNHTARREIHFIINGKNETRNSINLVCHRCVGPCIPAINNVAIDANVRLWSDPTSWQSGKLPLENEDVVVEPGWNMIYDLPESPIYRYVQINGRVTFKQDAPKLHFRAKYLFVRMGELIIGQENQTYDGDATITLYGMKQDEHIVYQNAIEAGNKILANTALISMYGTQRSLRSRLLKTIMPGDTSLVVETGLDWKVNDTIALPSTTMNWHELDTATILTYDNETGFATVDRKLQYYHWGSQLSTAPQYNGVDMRGEVMLLSRNIKIRGNDTDAWGCQIVTSDFVEGNLEQRVGRTYMDHVEIYNCSQYDTWKAAIRFEGAKIGSSKISNSSIHHGLGMAGVIDTSENIELINNNVYTFSRYGLVIQTSKNITLDGNWVSGIHNRGLVVKSAGDTQGGIVACGHFQGDKCEDIVIINNIVSSLAPSNVDSAGFSVPGHECGNYRTVVFRDNIAHSIRGYGAVIYRNLHVPIFRDCIEASRFIAYKCQLVGIVSNQLTDNVVFSNMTLIDNGFSASANIGVEGDKQTAKLRGIKFYGETDARECRVENICEQNGGATGCFDKNAIMPSSYADHSKPPLVSNPPAFPQFKIKADASFGGETVYENIQFINFKSGKTFCGMDQRIIRLNRFNADYMPATKFISTRFENVAQDSIAYLFTPPNEWAVLDDCGLFPCTGPLNTLIKFERSTFAGSITPLRLESNFQIIAANDENSGNFPTCKKVVEWNGYYCNNEDFAMITWESLDEDKMTRLVTPIDIIGMNLTTRNVINTFMDHMWDGFYTSMKRLSRFASIIQAGNGMMYELIYKGTPPLRQKFTLRSDELPVILRIKYPKAGVYIIKDASGKQINANAWDSRISQPMQIRGFRGGYCGENRYVGVVNILEFYLNKGCTIFIEPIDSIQASVRMNWTMAGFFADGGTTKFVDRVAASLGIKPANIKIVSVYQGSVVVDFTIIEDSTRTVSRAGGMNTVQSSLTQSLTSKAINLGAPILNAQVQVNKVASTAPAAQTYSISSTQVIQTGPNGQPVIVKDQNGNLVQAIINANSKGTPVIPQNVYNQTTVQVVKTQMESAGSASNSTMIAVIGSIIAVIIVGAVAGALIYKRYQQRLLELNAQKAKQVDQSSKINDDMSKPDMASGIQDEKYEQQYHPRMANVDIFGNGDIIKKGNEADQVNVDNVDDSDEEDEQSSNADNWNGAAQQHPTQSDLHTQNHFITGGNERGESPLGRHITNLNQLSPEMLTIKRVNNRANDDYQSTPSQAYTSSHKIVDGHLGVPK